jgi:hypothetical protein
MDVVTHKRIPSEIMAYRWTPHLPLPMLSRTDFLPSNVDERAKNIDWHNQWHAACIGTIEIEYRSGSQT